jgi:hypothetical protein
MFEAIRGRQRGNVGDPLFTPACWTYLKTIGGIDVEFDIVRAMRYLPDINVLVAAFRSRRDASHALLRLALSGGLPIVAHHKLVYVVYEYRDVLSRPRPRWEVPVWHSPRRKSCWRT